jgi:hypothetical protein
MSQCLSFSSVTGSEFISEQKNPKILRKNKVLWRSYSACLINIYHDPESNLELPERNEQGVPVPKAFPRCSRAQGVPKAFP